MTKIGLEIHCQLTNLKSKLFCSCKANYREFSPNTNICPICVGLPGTLPRLNKKAVEKSTIIALALNCETPPKIAFFRKNYFYPDLPKNFQITQLDAYGPTSIGHDGKISIEGKEIRIRRIQIEEDPGRLIYEGESEKTQITLVDYNRAGVPLVEIVTEPDFENPKQVRVFLNILVDLLSNLGVSDPTLDGALRADGNVSVDGGNKVEIKNVSSFHDLEKAVHFEITRQQSLVERKIPVISETRQWDEKRKITVSARTKEEEQDYRFFLEGDIPWVKLDSTHFEKLKEKMPKSIATKKAEYAEYLQPQVANTLATDPYWSNMMNSCMSTFQNEMTSGNADYINSCITECGNIITTNLMALEDTKEKREKSNIDSTDVEDIAKAVVTNEITRHESKRALHDMEETGKPLSKIISEQGLGNVSKEFEITSVIEEIIKEEANAVKEIKEKPETINFLVGQVMKKTKGKADPSTTLDILKKKLDLS